MRKPLKRFYGYGDLHFVTFSCVRRRPLLGTVHARDHFVGILNQVRSRFRFRLVGYVVMPEHVHLLIGETQKANPSKVLQVLKQKVSTDLRPLQANSLRLRRSSAAASGPGENHFWQRRFYDFNIWSSDKLREKLNYMHLNPVKRGLVAHPKEWPWSSWSFYEKGECGLIPIDLAGEEREQSQNPHP